MLNLAQRLAIPPPVRSRPSAPGATMSAGGNRERKDNVSSTQNVGPEEKDLQTEGAGVASRPPNVESMTTRGHLLFGPWGDVGAMSADDLRRRWKFSGMETSNAPNAATVGADSAAELRSSWRDLQNLSRAFTCMQNEREVLGTPRQVSRDAQARADVSSCSGEAEPHGNEIGSGNCNSQVATPDSPCAGGSSLGELSSRWRTLARVSSGRCSAGSDDAPDEISIGERSSSAKIASVDRKRIAELEIVPGQVSVDASSTPSVLATPTRSSSVFDDDVGSLAGDSLQSRWRDAFRQGERDVGATDVRALAARFSLVKGPQGVGGVPNANLTSRWVAARSKETVGATEERALTTRFSSASGAQGVGDMSNTDLTSRWIASRLKETVGATEVRALADNFSLAGGAQGVGDIPNSDLTSRWIASSKETVGATEVGALADRLSLASGAQGVGDTSISDLTSRWTAARSKDSVGAAEVGALADRFSLARGPQGVGAMSVADLTSRWTATRSKGTVGATELRALAARFSLAMGAQGVGDASNADLTSRWTASRSKNMVGATEVRALVDRFSLARGAQGVGDTSNAELTSRGTAARSKETVGATEVRALAARFSLASGPQGVGDFFNADLTSRWTAAWPTEEGRVSSGHVSEGVRECKKSTCVEGWCIVDGIATSSGEVGETYTVDEQAVGAVRTSMISNSRRAASDGAAPVG